MTNGQRAKIFAPYAALKGFGGYILGAEERGDEQILLGEDAQEELNRRLQRLAPILGGVILIGIGAEIFLTGVF